jgi:hypothetical protein
MAGSPPQRWGSLHWKLYHSLNWWYDRLLQQPATKVNEDDQRAQQLFLHIFVRVLPCGACREHGTNFHEQLEADVLPVEYAVTHGRCFERSVLLHNMVNKRLNKPEWSLPTAQTYWREPSRQAHEADLWEYVVRLAVHYDASHSPDKPLVYPTLMGVVIPWLRCLIAPFQRPKGQPSWASVPTTSWLWLVLLHTWQAQHLWRETEPNIAILLERLAAEMEDDGNSAGATQTRAWRQRLSPAAPLTVKSKGKHEGAACSLDTGKCQG